VPVPESLAAALGGRYALAGEVGRGGMATVYHAEDLKHHRPVALKVLRPDLAATLGADRFLKEIRSPPGSTTPTSSRCMTPARPAGSCST
jgi:serine/threonine-protein kinase